MIEALRERFRFKEGAPPGQELYQRAKELLERDRDEDGIARYQIVDRRDCALLYEELQQLGLEEFMDFYVGVPLVFISLEERFLRPDRLEIYLRIERMPNNYRDFMINISPKGKGEFRSDAPRWARHRGAPFFKGTVEITPRRAATENEIKGFQAILSKNLARQNLPITYG